MEELQQQRTGHTGGTSCAVAECLNYSRRPGSAHVSYHSFPKDELTRAIWTQWCRRENPDGSPWVPTRSCAICSDHFTPESFRCFSKAGKPMERKLLRSDAIPTIFTCVLSHQQQQPPPNLKRSAPSHRYPIDRYPKRKECYSKETQTETCGVFIDAVLADLIKSKTESGLSQKRAADALAEVDILKTEIARLTGIIHSLRANNKKTKA